MSRPAAAHPASRPFRLLAISQLATLAGSGGRGEVAPGWFAALAAAGVDALQLREKHLDDLGQCQLARSARTAEKPSCSFASTVSAPCSCSA